MTRERVRALKAVKWRLRSGLLYAGLKGFNAVLVGPDDAQVFDGRDNEQAKARFYSAILGCKLEAELI